MKTLLTLFLHSFLCISICLAQSNCNSALELTPGIQQCGNSNGNTGDFPSDGSSPVNPCNDDYNDDEYWFTYTPGNGVDQLQVTLSSISTFFTGIFIFDDCPADSPSCIVHNVNLASTSNIAVAFPVMTGTTYKIAVATFGPPDGTSFCLDAVETLCFEPVVSVPAFPVDATNCPSTVDYTISIDDLEDSGFLTISAEDAMGNPAGSGGVTNSTGLFTITDIPVPQSAWSITVAHENNSSCDIVLGPFELECPPVNDNLCDAIELSVNANFIVGNNEFSTAESSEPFGFCWSNGGNLNSVWYYFTAPNSCAVEISTDYPNTPLHDTHIAVFTVGNCSDLTTLVEIGCDEDSGDSAPNGNTSVVTLYELVGGNDYYIQIDGKQNNTGAFNLSVKEINPPNDDCSDAKELMSFEGTGSFLNDEYFVNATSSAYGMEACDNNSTPSPNDLWYVIYSQLGPTTVNVEPGPNSDVVVGIYGNCFPQLFMACSDDGGIGVTETVVFNVDDAGATFIRIYEKSASCEPFNITATLPALPIELDRFKAVAERKGNQVLWSTLSETNSEYIEVQSSPDGLSKWNMIGSVDTKGESSSTQEYEFFDFDPFKVTYYRLNMVDKDGSSQLSHSIQAKRNDEPGSLILFPNPVGNVLTVQISHSTSASGTYNIIDISGRQIKKGIVHLHDGLNTLNINVASFETGLYFLRLPSDNGFKIQKFIKQ
ncbi:MAG: T9SS type A sorting domain-containing protein [Bacteroidota bacterium]